MPLYIIQSSYTLATVSYNNHKYWPPCHILTVVTEKQFPTLHSKSYISVGEVMSEAGNFVSFVHIHATEIIIVFSKCFDITSNETLFSSQMTKQVKLRWISYVTVFILPKSSRGSITPYFWFCLGRHHCHNAIPTFRKGYLCLPSTVLQLWKT